MTLPNEPPVAGLSPACRRLAFICRLATLVVRIHLVLVIGLALAAAWTRSGRDLSELLRSPPLTVFFLALGVQFLLASMFDVLQAYVLGCAIPDWPQVPARVTGHRTEVRHTGGEVSEEYDVVVLSCVYVHDGQVRSALCDLQETMAEARQRLPDGHELRIRVDPAGCLPPVFPWQEASARRGLPGTLLSLALRLAGYVVCVRIALVLWQASAGL